MSGLARAVTWTQRVGYSYPPRYIEPVLRDRFPRLSNLEIEHCVSVHGVEQAKWMARCEAGRMLEPYPEASGKL